MSCCLCPRGTHTDIEGSAQEFLSGGLTWIKENVMCAGLLRILWDSQ